MELITNSGLKASQKIPADWLVKELIQISDIDVGLSKPKIIFGKGFLVVTVQDLYAGETIDSASLKRVVLTEEEVQRFRLFDGDILIGNASVKRSGIGYSNRFIGFKEPVIFAKYAYRVKNLRLISSQFLHYVLRLDQTRQWIISNSQTGTLTNLNKAAAKSIPIPFPRSIEEQLSITTALSDVDLLLDSLDRLIAKKRDLKQAAMQQLLTGQTRLPGFNGEWEVKQLGDVICEISDGGTPSTADSRNFGGDVPWVVIDDIKQKISSTRTTLTERGLQACAARRWPQGTLIVSTGATIGEVGILQVSAATKQGICGIIFDPLLATPDFMQYWFINYKKLLLSKAQGSSIKEVRPPTLVTLPLSLPQIDEQITIADVLKKMDEELVALESRRNKTAALKQGMMQELLTGRTRLV